MEREKLNRMKKTDYGKDNDGTCESQIYTKKVRKKNEKIKKKQQIVADGWTGASNPQL